MTILVTGATGNIGSEVVQYLLERKALIRGLVRDPKKATNLAQQGVELAIGDLSQPETLDAALQGIEKAFLVLPNLPNQVELECAFIDAAKQAGTQQIVKLSVMGAGELPSTFQKWHRQIEEHLEQSGIAWTHLRPNMLMQNMRWFAQTIAQSGSIYNCVGDTKISHVDARDVAAVAGVCLTEPGHENKSYILTGSQAITFNEIADIFAKALGRTVAYIDLPPADLKAARLANGEPEWYLDAELELFNCWKQGAGSAVTDTIATVTRHPATTYEEFAQYYAQTRGQDFFATVRG
ncbi:SDR family oxidoreductase [Nostocaceae cyanobacterium CENA357]|uniref:SDR family oxidoreductase n=1 Tax=Atlanticothrix silvestris CENA357 TaxID=1725252 RepID=A0A8J7HKS2_9CYAN|nr:SDR family oxidoreductase [Atlanticothrix silvestris]MBH8554400.1 SDR family oxidoreductase [Atlanticothrix silvestris CENA357]